MSIGRPTKPTSARPADNEPTDGAFRADIVVANINLNVLKGAAPHMHGTVILSGILTDDVDDLREDLPGDVIERRTAKEWTALVIRHE